VKDASTSTLLLIDRRKTITCLCYTLLFDTIIALFLTSVEFGGGFIHNFTFSQCIGISICSIMLAAIYFLKPAGPAMQLIVIMVAMTTGSIVGPLLGSMVAGFNPLTVLQKNPGHVIQTGFLGILFGSIITYIFISRERLAATKDLIQEERIKRLTVEKRMVDTDLRLLQAQIEPHFLFNTLSNVLSLLDTDPEKGKTMLMDLTHYLRTSLSKTREDVTSINHEMERIRNYLNIFKVRMGDRLRYHIHVPVEIKDIPFPPMLIQPLVENAIKHGLESKIEGGEISVRAEETGETIRLEVVDTGVGFLEGSSNGIGISNVKERLKSLYGDKGRLMLEENRPSGLKAIIEIPNGRTQSNNSR